MVRRPQSPKQCQMLRIHATADAWIGISTRATDEGPTESSGGCFGQRCAERILAKNHAPSVGMTHRDAIERDEFDGAKGGGCAL
jgi:hypothetical protein